MASGQSNADYGDYSQREAEVPAAPGVVGFLDTGVPWVRTMDELVREWRRLCAVIEEIKAGPFGQGADAADGCEQHAFGARAAALWTLGADPRAPMSRTQLPVTGQAIRDELDAAEHVMISRQRGWEYATGTLFWLLWITGATETMARPGFDAPPV